MPFLTQTFDNADLLIAPVKTPGLYLHYVKVAVLADHFIDKNIKF